MKINATITFASFYIAGIVAYFTHTIPVVAFALLVLTIFAMGKKLITNKAALIYYVIFALALLNCTLRIKSYDNLSQYIPSNAVIRGVVDTIPTTNNPNKTKFYIKVKEGSFETEDGIKTAQNINARTIVTIYDIQENTSKIKIADTVELTGKLKPPIKAKNPSQFDYANYLKNKNTFSTFYVKEADWKVVAPPQTFYGKFLQKLNDTRTKILNHQKKYMKPDNLEVLGGVVFGDDAINPPDHIRASFINSGLLHILAASGMNVTIIFGIWFFIGTRLRINYRLTVLIGALLVAFYTLMTGMGPSVLRAALMIEFVLLGKLIDRASDSIALVFFVAFLMLMYNPAMINDVGFQLSFVVAFAIMYYCPPILDGIKNKYLDFLVGAVLIPLVAQFWASPIQMFYFNTYAVYSVFANFAITIFITLISFLGFLCSILAMVPIDIFADKVCMLFAVVLNPIVSALISISNFFAELPNSLISTIHPHIAQISLYYSSLILFGFTLRNKFQNKKLLATCVVLFVIFGVSLINIPSKNCEIVVFDVGNADSFLIKTPKNKYLMIDTAHGRYEGSNATFSQADAIMNKYFKDNGIKRLDLLLLTHFDADHSGGAIDIMKAVNTKKLIVSKEKDGTKTTKAIFKHINENSIPFENAVNNKKVYEEESFALTTYTPDFIDDKNDNDNSTISLLSFKDFDMLFMADGGVKSFNKVEKDIKNNNIEILKSGHHGARGTVSTKMLKTINPDIAIVSTGLNVYGHPDKSTMETFAKNNVKAYRTDLHNAIKITTNGKTYKIYKYNTDQKRFVKDSKKTCR